MTTAHLACEPTLTSSQCQRLGISADDAAAAAEWARNYGQLTEDQRARLRAAGTARYLNGS